MMNIYENEELERKLEKITDLMGELILDVMLMSLKKINHEGLIFKEFLETRLEVYEDRF
jgi:hypothetical protein